jgi:hypothetical protein
MKWEEKKLQPMVEAVASLKNLKRLLEQERDRLLETIEKKEGQKEVDDVND